MRGMTASNCGSSRALIEHRGPLPRNVHVAPQVVDYLYFVTRAAPAWRSRSVEYKDALRERIATLTTAPQRKQVRD